MKILLANAIETFEDAHHQRSLCDRIQQILACHGHRVDRLTLPFVDDLHTIMEQMLAYRLLDLTSAVDRLIAFDSPACFLSHPSKIIIVSSEHQTLCSSSPEDFSSLHSSSITRKMEHARNKVFGESKAIFFDTNEAKQTWCSKHLAPAVFAECLEQRTEDEIAKLLTLNDDRYSASPRNKRFEGRAA
ncbi:hypothetical protein VN12_04545 [Pirellula sp. SH-Sr6A]|uniref:hypothetical protein n=1 Tax=Pirellula sp. SH-Sr6A TaxID=1632865 RepID=UPI00078CBE10|nr:hypothetical protein [Pirellula sp. SH-Sr6A]AMV31363.1 hypothetical protein VN12_04545 [Pirellula sp. SH-Sr6A]